MKIAPYLATSVERSYQRQQRIGERIAELKSRPAGAPQPAARVNISQEAFQASRSARRDLRQVREEQLEQLTERFVQRFLSALDEAGEGAQPEKREGAPGHPSFDGVLENLGLGVQRNPEGGGGAIVHKETGEVLVELTPEAREGATAELRKLARDILNELI